MYAFIRFRRQWCHVRCALWIPEVGFGNVERMEPITKCELIPVRTVFPASVIIIVL